MLDRRFYRDFRPDGAAPLRRPCLAAASPTLASDGPNLAAVFATLAHIRQDTTELDAVIDHAPKRVFEAGELSDGTLRYLALAGALLAYRLPCRPSSCSMSRRPACIPTCSVPSPA
jgi:predicted ATPase